jgi:integrase
MLDVRGHNEGSLYRRSRDGRWVAAVTFPDGVRRTALGRSRAEAGRRLAELIRLRDLNAGDPRKIRLGDYLARWVSELTQLAPATIRQHEMIVRVHLIPALGRRKLAELSPSDVDRYLDRTDLDPQTRRHHRSTLRRALADAVRDGLVNRNVAALARPPQLDRKERRYLTAAEVRRVMAEARDERLWPLWVVLANTGLRVSEALGLAWSDIEDGRLTVRYQLARIGGEWVRRQPKTRRSRRSVDLTPQAIDALAEQRRRQDAERGDYPQPIDGLVFTTETGKPIHSTNVLPSWYATLARLGLPRVTIHDLRHSTATILLAAGVPLPVIADILGHSTVRVTAALYAHVIPELRRDATDRLAEALS